MRVMKFFVFCVSLVMIAPISSQAAIVNMPLHRLVQDADVICSGNVVSVETRAIQRPNGTPILETAVEIAVDETLKGEYERELRVIVPGGSDGEKNTMMSEDPIFTESESVVLFLKKAPDGRWRTLYHRQGKRTFISDDMRNEFIDAVQKLLTQGGVE